MNLLAFVFSILLLLSYSFTVLFEKSGDTQRLRFSYIGHFRANHKILNSYEKQLYKSFPGVSTGTKGERKTNLKNEIREEQKTPEKSETEKWPPNPECARLNLISLLDEGREKNEVLYDVVLKLFSTFYGELLLKEKTLTPAGFLQAFLQAAREQRSHPLEKLEFKDKKLREVYYRVLKGSKDSHPPLLDYVTLEQKSGESKICLFHAHPNLLGILFGGKTGLRIHQQMHQKKAPPMTKEAILRLCNETHTPLYQTEIFTLLLCGKATHPRNSKQTLLETDSSTVITLRKDFYIKSTKG